MDVRASGEPGMVSHIRGREGQLESLGRQLEAVQDGRGGIVLVTGQAGMGKTVLLNAAGGIARERGIQVFRSAGDIAGRVIPFAPLLEALASAPNAPVDPAALRDFSRFPDQRFWLLRELQEGLEQAALRAPVLISLDDMQWSDEATLAALGTLPRQLATHRILWLFAARSAELTPATRATMARLEAADALRITLNPLDEAAVAAVAGDVLGGVPDAALLRVLAGVRGQPFLLTELLRGMRDEGLAKVDGGIVRLARTGIPLRFVGSVDHQLARLSAGARDVLQMACVLGRRFSADELAGLTGLTLPAVLGALREALAAGLVAEDGDRIAFRHDLVREAVDASLPRTVRQSLRRRAIGVMLRHGAPPSDVAELVMDVASPGDTEAIGILRRAAAETGRVSPSVASVLSRRALDLTPAGDPGRGPLTAETLDYLVLADKAAAAVNLIAAAGGDLSDPATEAEARLRVAIVANRYEPADAVEQCRRALDLPGLPAPVRIMLLWWLALACDSLADAKAADNAAKDAAETARESGDAASEAIVLSAQSLRALARGDWQQANDLIGNAVARQRVAEGMTAVRHLRPSAYQVLVALCGARLDDALAIIDTGTRDAQQDGLSGQIRIWSFLRCLTMFSAGRLADARSDAEAAIEMADEVGDGSYGYFNRRCLYLLGRIALHTGEPAALAQARRSAAQLLQARDVPSRQSLGTWLAVLLADADGDTRLAVQTDVQILDPLATGPLPATSSRMYAEAAMLTRILLKAGRQTDAASVVARIEDFARLHPDFPFLDSAALHARAVLDSDPEAALRAVTLSSGDPRPLVRAAILEDAGRLLPLARADEAVSLLETALASYTEAQAERDAARVRSLLRARGGRPSATGPRSAPGWPELTESEFAVVSLVARGATNREVAEHLFLSPYTVNTHLRHVFAKLGLRSRVELARLATTRGILASDISLAETRHS